MLCDDLSQAPVPPLPQHLGEAATLHQTLAVRPTPAAPARMEDIINTNYGLDGHIDYKLSQVLCIIS